MDYFRKYTILFFLYIYYLVKLLSNKLDKTQWPTASRFLGMTHSFFVLYYSIPYLMNHYPNYYYLNHNTDMEEFICHISMAYFIVDMYHFIKYESNDFLMFLHHIICILFISSVLYYKTSALSLLVGLAWGELTNPIMSTWYISKQLKYIKFHNFMSHIFTWTFFIVRILIIPFWIWDIYQDYRKDDGYRFFSSSKGDIF